MRKIRRNGGKEYITKNGKVVRGEVFENNIALVRKNVSTYKVVKIEKLRLSTFGI